jgi:hypothetical protein
MASLKIDAQDFEKQIIVLQNAIVAAGGTLPIKQRVDASDFEQQIIRLQTSAVALGASLPIKQRIDNSDLAQQLMALQAAVAAGFTPLVATTFDPAHTDATVIMTNGNLTIAGNFAGWKNSFGTVSRASSKPYVEFKVDVSTATDAIGLANNSLSSAGPFPGADFSSIGWINDGRVLINSAVVATIATWTTGSLLSMFADLDNGEVYFRVGAGNWNNNPAANPATNTGGISLSTLTAGPYWPVVSPAASSSQFTANFGKTPYAQSVPSGGGNWVPFDSWVPGQRPFSAASPANQLLAANSILTPVNWPVSHGNEYALAPVWLFDIPAANAPVVSFRALASWGFPNATINRPMTSGFNNTGAPDAEAVSIIGNDCLSMIQFHRFTDTTANNDQTVYAHEDIVNGTGFGTRVPFLGKGVYAVGSCCLLGALLKEEFTAGEIHHWIGFCGNSNNVNGADPYYFPPAISGDGVIGNGLITEGQLAAIPKNTVMPSGMTVFGQKAFRAMRDYGAWCFDKGGALQLYLGYSYNNPSASWQTADTDAFLADVPKLFSLLQKVGPPLDGIGFDLSVFGSYAPQLQQSGYAGSAMHVTRDSGGAQDIGFTAAPQSLLDTASIASFGSGTTVRVATYKTQDVGLYTSHTGGFDLISSGANAPIIYQAGALKTINGQPALAFDGTNYFKATGSSAGYPNGGMYLAWLGQIPDYAANYTLVGPDVAGGLQLRVDATTGLVRLLKNGGATIAVTPYQIPINVPVLISALYRADGSAFIWLNGSPIVRASGSTLVSVNAANIQVNAGPGGAEPFKGVWGAVLIGSNIGADITNPQFAIERYLMNLFGPMGTIIVNTTALDPAHTDANVALSNGNLTATQTFGANWKNTFGTLSKSSGLYYDEVTIGVSNGTADAIGIANNSLLAAGPFPGNDLNSVGYINDGRILINSVLITTLATWTSGSVLGRAVDFGNKKVWFRVGNGGWNNDILANQNPATNTGGIPFSTLAAGPYFPVLSLDGFGSIFTWNAGATAYTQIPPSGFGMWQ